MKHSFCFLLLLLTACEVAPKAHEQGPHEGLMQFDGNETGNGADVIFCSASDGDEESVELLDLYEAYELFPKFKLNFDSGEEDLPWKKRVSLALDALGLYIPKKTQQYRAWLHSFELETEWILEELPDIEDSFHLFFPENCEVRQLIIQLHNHRPEQKKYFINQVLWDMLDEANKAAAVLHEIIYREAIHYGATNSIGTRSLNRLLWSQDFAHFTKFWLEDGLHYFIRRKGIFDFEWPFELEHIHTVRDQHGNIFNGDLRIDRYGRPGMILRFGIVGGVPLLRRYFDDPELGFATFHEGETEILLHHNNTWSYSILSDPNWSYQAVPLRNFKIKSSPYPKTGKLAESLILKAEDSILSCNENSRFWAEDYESGTKGSCGDVNNYGYNRLLIHGRWVDIVHDEYLWPERLPYPYGRHKNGSIRVFVPRDDFIYVFNGRQGPQKITCKARRGVWLNDRGFLEKCSVVEE